MSPPSSRPPRGSEGNDAPSSGRRAAPTVCEVATPAPQPDKVHPEKKTLFGFARASFGIDRSRIASSTRPTEDMPIRAHADAPSAPPAAVAVGRMQGIGSAHSDGSSNLGGATVPQYGLSPSGQRALKEELSDVRVAPVHQSAAVQSAAPAQAARQQSPHAPLPPSSDASALPVPSVYVAPPAASAYRPSSSSTHASPPAPAGSAGPSSLGGPDGATAYVDVRSLMAQQVELPEVGRADEGSAAWSRQVPTQPDASPLRLESAPPSPFRRRRGATQGGAEPIDVNQLLGRLSGRTLLLSGVCAVVVLLAALSFLAPGSAPSSAQLAGRAPALPAQVAPKPKLPVAAHEQRSTSEQRREPSATTPESEPAAATAPSPNRRAERVSATPQRAAVLYIEGKYKEALAEYRLLVAAYPDQRVYAELARILKRKIIDSCLRTQPNRREQCRHI